jgi:hypothetical protein
MAGKSNGSVDDNQLVEVALIISVLLAGWFFYDLLRLLQDLKQFDILGSPNSFAAWPSGLLALYIFIKDKRPGVHYVAVATLTVILSGFLVWLFGATGYGEDLATNYIF